jgi:biopolymer transport protein ExbB/TolQ
MTFRAFSAALWLISVVFVLWIAFAALFGPIDRLPLIGNMLARPFLLDRATPILIILLFTWILIEIARKVQQVRRERLAVVKFQRQIAKVDQNISSKKGSDPNEPRALRRAVLIMECGSRSPSSLHEAMPATAALDGSALTASYTPLQVYAWILPVLGFIGTASGMATAIDGFKDVLRGGQIQVDSLAFQLSQSVIPGLSAAFETTILALSAASVTYFCTNALKGWDQEALDELDRLSIIFLSHIPPPTGSDGGNTAVVLEQISKQLLSMPMMLEQATNSVKSAANSLNSASNETTTAANSIAAAAQLLASASKDLQESASAPYQITIKRGAMP